MSRGLTAAVVDSVMASWQPSTREGYETAWRGLRDYFAVTDVAQVQDVTVVIANFLQSRFDAGLSAGYVGNMRSSISTVLELATGKSLAEDVWTSRMVRGQRNIRPAAPAYEDFFELDVLFEHMMRLPSYTDISDKDLQAKMVVLLRVAIVGRSADAASIIFSKSRLDVHGLHLTLGRLKPDKQYEEHPLPVIEWLEPQHGKICVCRCFEQYCRRVAGKRTAMLSSVVPQKKKARKWPLDKDRLLLGRDQGSFPISPDRVASISKDFMADAGIDVDRYQAHAIRGATATAMLDAGADPTDVMQRGRWKSASTFKRFYDRSRRSAQMPAAMMISMAKV